MKNNVPRSVLFGFLSTLLPLISTFVVTPFVVGGLGAEEYGLFALVITFIAYSFNFGIGRSAAKYIAEYRAAGDNKNVGEIVAATLFLNIVVGAVGATILIWLATPLVQNVLLIEVNQQPKAVTAFYLAAVTIVFLLLQQLYSAVLQAAGKFDWFSHITTVVSTVLSVGNLILVFWSADAVTLLWWNLAITIVGGAAFYTAARIFLPEVQFNLYFRWQALRLVAGFSFFIVAYQIAANAWFIFERAYITRAFGTQNLTFYVVTMALAMFIHTFIISLSLVLMPLTSELSARNDDARLHSIYERAIKYIALVVIFVCLCATVGGKAFLTLWLGADFAEQSATILLFHVLTFGAMSVSIVSWQMNEGLGAPWRNTVLVIGWTVGGIFLLLILSAHYQLAGAAAARAVVVVLPTPVFMLLTERAVFGKVYWAFWHKAVLSLLLAGGAGGAAIYLLLQNLPLNWLTFLLALTAGGLLYLGVLFAVRYLTLEEQQWLRRFAHRAVAAN